MAAMAMCGCRPSEFEGGGVTVEKVDADTYRFHIAGKKTGTREKNGKTFTTGQTLRTITVLGAHAALASLSFIGFIEL
ncbi:MAG: hypothetical protein QM527_15245 [Alphaproteobacteria bacterium]|nr:hypothetical protein [Alphaproteobacteria bacterium]